jgi:hypothetical protein
MIKTNHHLVSILRDVCSLPEDILFFIVSFLGPPNYCKQLCEMRSCLSIRKTNFFGECFEFSYSIEEDEQFCIQFGDPLLYWYFRDKMDVSKALLFLRKKTKYMPGCSDAVQLLKESNFQLFDLHA